jgi:DNA polymerase elongation subunit (family B)
MSTTISTPTKTIIVKKKKITTPDPSFRLIDFSVVDMKRKSGTSSASGSDNDSPKRPNGPIDEYDCMAEYASPDASNTRNRDEKSFVIQMFGINESGETCSILVDDFLPFFYVKVSDNWTMETRREFLKQLKSSVGPYYENSIISDECKFVNKKKLYGFDGGKEHKFLMLKFKNVPVMNKVKNLWYQEGVGKFGERCMRLKPSGLECSKAPPGQKYTQIYEANIPPLLRYFHIMDISPSGWIQIPLSKTRRTETKFTTCTYEYEISATCIVPLNQKETVVPYKICSFDIEASSSHGDFPIPIKTYKKLAGNIVDIYNKLKDAGCGASTSSTGNVILTEDILRRIMNTAYGYDDYPGVDVVYPKRRPSPDKMEAAFTNFVNRPLKNLIKESVHDENTIERLFDRIKAETMASTAKSGNAGDDSDDDDDGRSDADDSDDADDGDNHPSGSGFAEERTYSSTMHQAKPSMAVKETMSITVLDLINSKTYDRETKITQLSNTLGSVFPKLEGDKVTFIGSTFVRYGVDGNRPYLNHCIALDTCDELTNVPNSVIESYKTEQEVLLAWTNLIQRENPDIIIGYNIFGFDYEFMFRRAIETDCCEEFLMLSRNMDEFCGKKDMKTGKPMIEENSIVLASGQYDLHFIKMTGRLQIDLYNYFRRDYNLTSYKLDYVSGYFIGDDVKKLEYDVDRNRTRIFSGNLTGLDVGNYINFEESSHSTDTYKDGAKFQIVAVDKENRVFEIAGHETPDMRKSVRWGLAKDDVSPQDIFRMTKEGPAERAVIAKYCIQDCNLVHHLMNKIDVMTGYIEMSKICSVPIGFLVMRGQGIKLTSFIAKKCSEKNTLMPVLDKDMSDDSYEGAIVLPPKCNLYLDNPVACLDYSSLYPSSMISENLSHDSKVWTKEYTSSGELVHETGEKDATTGEYVYDNMPGYKYVDVKYDTYRWVKNSRGKSEKVVNGYKVCRWAQPKNGVKAIMPSVLEELLAARKSTRKLAESQTDPFMANILDKRQLGYKVTANSLYGQCGAKTSTFYEVDVAASTTATGRKLLTYGKRIVEEVYGNATVNTKNYGFVNTKAEYIYGDSVANYTPVYVRENGGPLVICTIDELGKRFGVRIGGRILWRQCTEIGKQTKEVCELRPTVETWSDKGWTKIHRVIRHALAPTKKMFRVITHLGLVDVTDDHSLVCDTGAEISPKDITVGRTRLLHHRIDASASAAKCDVSENANGIPEICDIYSTHSQIHAARYWNAHCNNPDLRLFINYDTLVSYRVRASSSITPHPSLPLKEYNCVTKFHEIEYPSGEYVYDLTTDNHHFAAGVGDMIVHNTDSVFFTFNLATPDGIPIRGKDALEITIEIAQQVGHLATKFLKPPHAWVYEKTLMPFCLLSKKRYVGMLYETKPEKPKRKSMGIVLKRRDNAPIVKDVYGGIIDILMKEQNIDRAVMFLRESLQNIIDEKSPLEKLIITKALRSDYKNPQQIAHKVLADRMGVRDPGNKPSTGDRIPYIYINNNTKGALQGDKIEHPDYIIKNNIRPNYSFYITNQIMKPVQQLFALVLERLMNNKELLKFQRETDSKLNHLAEDAVKYEKKLQDLRNKEVKRLLFDEYLKKADNINKRNKEITEFFQIRK